MNILGKKLHELTLDDINRMISSQVQESKTLDYKSEINIEQGDGRKEFLADISAFINTEGGVIIYGVKEQKDYAGKNLGIPEELSPVDIFNKDKFIQQIEDLVQNNLEPKVNNLSINLIEVEENKFVVVLGTSKAKGLPHMVTYKATNKFYKRRNSGKYLVDVFELRNLFIGSYDNREKAERFRESRVNQVRNLEFLPKLDVIGSYFLHIIPLANNEYSIDLSNERFLNDLRLLMKPPLSNGWDHRHNLEGWQTFSTDNQNVPYSYFQLFRNGILEIYTSHVHAPRLGQESILDILGLRLENITLEYVAKSFELYEKLEIEPPFIIMVSLFDIKDGSIIIDRSWRSQSRPIPNDKLLLPPVVIFDTQVDINKELKSLFDIIWQTGSVSKSPFYHDNGDRKIMR